MTTSHAIMLFLAGGVAVLRRNEAYTADLLQEIYITHRLWILKGWVLSFDILFLSQVVSSLPPF